MKFPAMRLAGCFFLAVALVSADAISATTGPSNIVTSIGWNIARAQRLNGIELNAWELTNFLTGFSLGARDRHLPFDMREMSPDIDALAKLRQQNVIATIKQRNAAAAQKFLAAWKQKAAVVTLSDGVRCQVLEAGDGTVPKPMQTVRVFYVARLLDGTEVTRFGPDNLILVTNHLERGLFDGFQKIGRGGKMELYLPPEQAAEQVNMADASPGSALLYEIRLIDVKDTSKEDLEEATIPPAPEAAPCVYSNRFPGSQIIEAWGWEIAQRNRLWKLSLNDAETVALTTGFEAGVRDQSVSDPASQTDIDAFIEQRKREGQIAFRKKQAADMTALFDSLGKNTNVVVLPDGLRYEILKTGTGPFPKMGQTVLVNYTGRLINGHVFDETANEPLHVEVGRVIKGWNEGIQRINGGGKIRLYIPPALGYGGDAVSGIPADSTLIYDIELIGIDNHR